MSNTQPETDKRGYVGLQALRAVAALGVVAYHGTQLWGNRLTVERVHGAGDWAAGATGVDIFFVISGFVMMLTSQKLIRAARGAAEFLRRRIIRIVPLYWLVTTIKLLGVLAAPRMALEARPSWLHILGSYFFIPYHYPGGEVNVLLVAGWTLVFEMFFYLVFAAGLAARANMLHFLTVALLLCGLAGFVPHPHWDVALYVVNPIVLEFLAGIYLARAILSRRKLMGRKTAIFMGIAWLLCIAIFPAWGLGRDRILIAGVPAALLVTAVLSVEPDCRRLIPNWFLKLGDASYSIYLVHGLVLPAVGVLLVKLGFFGNASGKTIAVVSSLVVSSVVGLVMYRLVERPVTDWLKRRWSSPSEPVTATV